ncbi:MAG TPA: hypothetical protein VF550_07080 [Polyangia bacterium]
MSRPSLFCVACLALSIAGCVAFNPSVVQPSAYLGHKDNPITLYGQTVQGGVLLLFDVTFPTMDALMLFGFEDDPSYREIELQIMREGAEVLPRVVLYRQDGGADIYMRPNPPLWLQQMGRTDTVLNRRRFLQTEIDYHFAVAADGLRADLMLKTTDGVSVSFHVNEHSQNRIRTNLIAPIGADTKEPTFLPLFYIQDLDLVPRARADLWVSIGDQRRAPAPLTRLVKGPTSYLVRYSTHPLIGRWNERKAVALAPVSVAAGQGTVRDGQLEYQLLWNGNHPEIAAFTAHHDQDALLFRFVPALPDLMSLNQGAVVEGRFALDANADKGVLAGEYRVQRGPLGVHLRLHPTKVFQPPVIAGGPWVATYDWDANFTPGADGTVTLEAGWSRRK